MREKMLSTNASRISALMIVLLPLIGLGPFFLTCVQDADAAAGTTVISPSGGTGSRASLGTVITSGTSTVPTNLCTANCVITGGTKAGSNLFHSFGDFSVGTLDGARFQTGLVNPVPDPSVANILGRVTGGNASSIFGNINSATFYPSANLFLMNPAGFLFGANATVNVGGMVAFTTADYIRLTDNARFNNVPNPTVDALLSSSPVAAFGFIGSNPAAINFEGGQLTVAEGSGLTLIAGNINLLPDATNAPSGLTAPGGALRMTSVGGPGEVAANGVPIGSMLLGSITLGQGTILDTSYNTGAQIVGDGSGGPISIRSGQLVGTGATITTSPAAGTMASGGAVAINVTGTASFTDTTIQTSPVFDFSFTGSAGAVSISADEGLTLTRTTIDASSFFAGGDAGSVTLNSSNGPVSLADSSIATFASAPGNGGAVTITGKDVTLTRSGIITDVDTGLFDFTIDDPALGLVHPGTVTITAQNTVTFSGSRNGDPTSPVISATALGTLVDAGSVTITGKTLNLSNGSILTNMNEGTIPSPGNGGPIEIRGNDVNLSQFTLQSINAGFFDSTGKGGNIVLRGADNLIANNIQLNGSIVDAASVSGGGGGTIGFQTKALTLSDNSVVRTSTFATGAGGTITVGGAENVTVQSASRIATDSIGNALPEKSAGIAGAILIATQNLAVLSGGHINAGALKNSTGNAGNITVQGTNSPTNSILIDGAGSGIFTTTQGTGAGGSILLNANTVTVQNSGTLSATTSGPASTSTGGSILVNANTVGITTGGTMTAASTGAGASGEVIVQGLASPAQLVSIDGGGSGILTTTSSTGGGGNISMNANTVNLQNGARISSSSTGTGVAGNINITAGSQFTMTSSSVTTEANQSSGGAIKITTNPDGTVQLTNSLISASVLDGAGGGGSVNIDPQFVVLQNSQILANSVFGPGGNIFITTNLLLPDSASIISASSQFGQQGTVTIQSPISPASGKITPLLLKPLVGTSLVNQRCAALAGGNISSFTVAGRDTLPAEPSGWLSSPLALGTLTTRNGPEADGDSATPLLSLRQIAPPGFLTQMFAVASDCQS
jgi:filamentous hemagglutinin family protein